ncbi:hypothetical protein TWF173_002597 [Orbilia oligospora]|nr:hypothetical protein TWF173_002597 [Orbilia oligospora]
MSKRKRNNEGTLGESFLQTATGSISLRSYTIGWICALSLEMAAAKTMLDEIHLEAPKIPDDDNSYILGSVAHHNVVIVCLPAGGYGTINATAAAARLKASFPSIEHYLMVGIGGGVPDNDADIRLGDIVVSIPTTNLPGVVQYDLGKTVAGGHFQRIGVLNKPPHALLSAVSKLRADHKTKEPSISRFITQAIQKYPLIQDNFTYPGAQQDQLFDWEYEHTGGETCRNCDINRIERRASRSSPEPRIHYGVIASGNQVIKHGQMRNKLAKEMGVYCVEMEAAGLMDTFPCLVIRGICDYADSHKNKKWQDYSAATAAAYTKELLCFGIPGAKIQKQSVIIPDHDQEEIELVFLQSLSFLEIDNRRDNIENPIRNTCDWFFETEVFTQWLQRQDIELHNGVLWIKGKPGAGKSTLLKHTLNHCEGLLKDHMIAAYFFSARSSERLEKSFIGMLRSLIHQVLDQDSQLCQNFISCFRKKKKKHGPKIWNWSEGELKNLFIRVVTQSQQPIVLFVDALDECDEAEIRAVVAYLENLSSVAIASKTDLSICLSSRHYPTITMQKSLQIILESDVNHQKDIEIYIQERLTPRIPETQWIRARVRTRAEGVFMWAVLVVEMLNRAFDEGDIAAVEYKLRQIPQGLEKIFLDLLGKNNAHEEETLLILQWQLFAAPDLGLQGLYEAVKAGTAPDSLVPRVRQNPLITLDTIKRYITSTSKGLIEVAKSGWESQFIHETVRDFLLRNQRLETLYPILKDQMVKASHKKLADCCLTALKNLSSGVWSSQDIVSTTDQPSNFFCYAAASIFYHIRLSEMLDTELVHFLEVFRQPRVLKILYRVGLKFEPSGDYGNFTDNDLLQVISRRNCPGLVRILLTDGNISAGAVDVNISQNQPLISAIQNAILYEYSLETIEVLIEGGSDPNQSGRPAIYGTSTTPLEAAALYRYQMSLDHEEVDVSTNIKIIKMLVAAGANINLQGPSGSLLQTCITQRTCSKANIAVIKALIDLGADVHAEDGGYKNALDAMKARTCLPDSGIMATPRVLNKTIFTPTLYQSIRDLWFSGLPWAAKSPTEEATQRWFSGSKEAKAAFDKLCHLHLNPAISSISPSNFPIKGLTDAEIAAPFVAEIEAAEGSGDAEAKTKTALSFMILLDQIPRNLYRTKETLPLVYTHYDPIAVSLARHITSMPIGGSSTRWDLLPGIRHSLPYRQWFYMPLMHSENLADHKNFINILEELKEETKEDEEITEFMKTMEIFENMHVRIVERFGRYPHRNDGLGRESTNEEKEWLEGGGEKFGVGG